MKTGDMSPSSASAHQNRKDMIMGRNTSMVEVTALGKVIIYILNYYKNFLTYNF